jgi:hypothetical protein
MLGESTPANRRVTQHDLLPTRLWSVEIETKEDTESIFLHTAVLDQLKDYRLLGVNYRIVPPTDQWPLNPTWHGVYVSDTELRELGYHPDVPSDLLAEKAPFVQYRLIRHQPDER